MKFKLLLVFGILFVLNVEAQDKKWNVEANYSLVPAEGFFGEDNNIDLGVKYRGIDFSFFKLGLSINGGYFIGDKSVSYANPDSNTYLLQPRVFSELDIPGMGRLKPSVGLGYSFIHISDSFKSWDGGFNFNLGLSYDIFKTFFIQTQYDFINLHVKEVFLVDGISSSIDFREKLNNIKIGLGVRF